MEPLTLSWSERFRLANLYAPHLVLFPENEKLGRPSTKKKTGDYHPRTVELLIEHSRISDGWFSQPQPAALDTLSAHNQENAQLLVLPQPFPNPTLAWKAYFTILNDRAQNQLTGRERYPVTVYARAQTRDQANTQSRNAQKLGEKMDFNLALEVGRPLYTPAAARLDDLTIQYWFCYYYDDWANQHEGDWEGICLFFRNTNKNVPPPGSVLTADDYVPVGANYYAHETGLRRRWQEVERVEQTHPLVYVAAGSHASYFQHVQDGYTTTVKKFILPFVNLKLNIGLASQRIDAVPDSMVCAPIKPAQVIVLPEPSDPASPGTPEWKMKQWLAYPGHWGVNVLGPLGFGGPTGPQQKKLKWHNPFIWMERNCVPDFLVY